MKSVEKASVKVATSKVTEDFILEKSLFRVTHVEKALHYHPNLQTTKEFILEKSLFHVKYVE